MTDPNILAICADKFGQSNVVVISVFEAYQLVREENQPRLMVLVHRNQATALFSCTLSNNSPLSFTDLAVDKLYAIDGTFRMEQVAKTLQFKVMTEHESVMYYFYPFGTYCQTTFDTFLADVRAAEVNYQEYAEQLDFAWLTPYRRLDQTAIDMSIADGRSSLMKRESKFQEELERRENEYMKYVPYKIYVATWNVNGQAPGDICLDEWLHAMHDTDVQPDIYAIAFQELDLSAKAFTVSEKQPDPIWIQKIMNAVGGKYVHLESVRLVGMQLTLVVREEVRRDISRTAATYVGTGALNMMGNKGAVGISIEINEAKICFVNSHFAAHVSEVQRRKEDHDEILRRMQFEIGITRRFIVEHEHIFWFGDLNYRISEPPQMDLTSLRQRLASGSPQVYESIRYLDQLYNEQQKHRVFVNFTEGPIQFRPTYKYDPGTNNWDSSEKCRAPAWCDRVLWKSDRTGQLAYGSVMALKLSDHKPVYSLFVTEVKTCDKELYKKVHEDVLKTVDKYENDNQPQITVPEKDIDFGTIRFGERIVREILIANNCHLPATFRFKSKEGGGSPICESWMKLEPTMGKLLTGDVATVRLELFVDSASAWKMHRKQRESHVKMPLDILVLHVDNGHDIFISVIGEYLQSCVGFNMETLSQLEHPIGKMNLKQVLALERRLMDTPLSTGSIPRELWFLADFMKDKGFLAMNLFTVNRCYARNPHIVEIRDWLDTWSTDLFPGTAHTAAEMFVMLLEGSPLPLIHPFEKAVLEAETPQRCQEIVRHLVVTRKQILIYVIYFLKTVLERTSHNQLTSVKLARIFAPALLKPRTEGQLQARVSKEHDDRRVRFLTLLIDRGQFSETDFKFVQPSMSLVDTT